MAYIAAKPVRFDRDYKIGEVIPPEMINQAMARKLVEMGKIIEVNLPEPKKQEPKPTESPEAAPDAMESAEGNSTPEDEEPQAEGRDDGENPAEMLTGHLDAEQLLTWKNADLEKLAADMGVDISKAKNKAERAQLIAAVEVGYPANDEDAKDGIELPDESE